MLNLPLIKIDKYKGNLVKTTYKIEKTTYLTLFVIGV